MALTKTSFGLEIGPSSARIAELRLDRSDRPVVCALDRFDFAPSARRGGEAGEPLRRAIGLLAVAHPIGARDGVVAAFSAAGTDNRVVSVAPVEAERAGALGRKEAIRTGGFFAEGCVFAALNLPSISVNERRVLVAAHPDLAVRETRAVLEEAGAAPDAMLPTPLALANLLRFDGHTLDESLVVRIADRETDLLLFSGDAPWFRTLPLGTVAIAEALSRATGAGAREAEAVRIGLARGEEHPPAQKAVAAFLERVLAEASAALEFHRRHVGPLVPSRILLAGEAARLPGAIEAFSRAFSCRVEPVDRLNRVRIAREAHGAAELRDLPNFAPAIGAALQGVASVPFPLTFVEPDRERSSARRVPGLAAATLLFLAVAAAADRSTEVAVSRSEVLRVRADTIEARAAQLGEERRRLAEAAEAFEEVERLRGLVPRRDDWERIPPVALDALSRAGALLDATFRETPSGIALDATLRPDDSAEAALSFHREAGPALREAGATDIRIDPAEPSEPGAEPRLRARVLFGRER